MIGRPTEHDARPSAVLPDSNLPAPVPVPATDPARSRLLLLAAAVLWSLGGVLAKNRWIEHIPLAERGPILACYRALFAAAFLAPFVSWSRLRWHSALLPSLIAYTLMNVLYVSSLTRTTAAAAIFLQYTAVGWSAVLGWWILGERPRREDWVALGFTGLGIAWIVSETSTALIFGNLIGVASGLAYGGVMVGFRSLRSEDPVWVVMISNLTAGLCLLPWVSSMPVSLGPGLWGVLAVFGVVQLALPYLLFAVGVRGVPAHEAALITLIEAVLNPIWVWLLVGERAAWSTWVGGACILTGLAVKQYLARRATADAQG